MATKCGLKCEEYEITTKDGYILGLFHLPGDPSCPVLLVSGAFGTADDYILRGNTSLPHVLHEAGYDVWVGNVRGCRYGRKHLYLDPDEDDEFWDFSFHEYAIYDVAAMIDFILKKTQQTQVNAISWSVGTSLFYILGSVRPEYNNKVKVQLSMAPIAYLHHSPGFAAGSGLAALADFVFNLSDKCEIYGKTCPETILLRSVCSDSVSAYAILELFFFIYGFDAEQIELDYAKPLFTHYPSAMSRKTLEHLTQVLITKRYAPYDYGMVENRRKYGTIIPPEYNLKKNNMSIILISGKNDMTSTLADVALLKPKLGNLVEHIILEPEKFNHIDFVHGKDSHEVFYKPTILEILNKYN